MYYTKYIKRVWNVSFATIFNDVVEKKDPDIFEPNGSQIYHGYQGEGKTVSMYYHFTKLKEKYPNTLVISNLVLKDYEGIRVKSQQELFALLKTIDKKKQYILFETHADLILLLRDARNGDRGTIFLIDEIHNYFHSHDSKSMPMWVVQVFSQQRKQHLVILGTVQMWEDVIKAIRQQIDNLIECSRFAGYFIRHFVIDPREYEMQYGEKAAPIKKRGFFFLTRKIRNGFDTYQVINSGREIMGGNDLAVNVINQEKKPNKFGWR